MKKIYLLLILIFLTNNKLQSQDKNLFIKDFDITQISENQLNVNLKVYSPDLADYNEFIIDYSGNTITLKVCYDMYFIPAISNLENDFQINLPSPISNYTLKVEIYRSTSQGCLYQASLMQDSATLDFTTPFTGTISLSTNDIKNDDKNLILYPNPVKDILHFSEEVSNVRITDLSGKVVKQTSAKGESVDVSKLPKGNYLLSFNSKTGSISTKKFIKK
ncbi:T9SS type A sorting domain-containing protein [Epilithonimonas hispanica]|uniref:Secretion system C-terminal sorting domain-containing protein n=1 Tax=Epilithonimonas hispanica TaxID=358687 RepID=A0A3D9D1D3_9FLAO|nr:T9SS type A sorting domain-containing protein [Epilithonimonas hispanica]REC71737.1 hypothetical protein DRF58_05165 [Epilithonimonas hispanica]